MWIKLISPAVTRRPMDSDWKTHMAPPLALLVLGALTPPRHRVTVVDENVQPLDLSDQPDLVGMRNLARLAKRVAYGGEPSHSVGRQLRGRQDSYGGLVAPALLE